MPPALIVLARAPSVPGKIRLRAGLAADRAAAIRRALLLECLIGMTRMVRELLVDVPWGTPDVLTTTLQRAEAARVPADESNGRPLFSAAVLLYSHAV